MAFKCGFNFRATSGFVTDGADEVFVDAADTYPTTKTNANGQSATFGWDSSVSERDRDNSIDQRLAGTQFSSGATRTFRVDLENSGDHDIRAAFGDTIGANIAVHFDFYDDATLLFASTDRADISTNENAAWVDATDVIRGDDSDTATAANDWVNNNAKRTETFSSTTFNTDVNPNAGSDNDRITHLFVEEVATTQVVPGSLSLMGVGK